MCTSQDRVAIAALGGRSSRCAPGGKGTLLPDRIHDVIVAGAGPAGSRVARDLALRGFDVVVLEEHSGIGTPCHCSGLISPRTMDLAGVGDDIILNTIRGAVVHLPGSRPVRVAGDRVHGYVIDRIEFDRRLASQAVDAGATFMREARLTGFSVIGDAAGAGEVVAQVVRDRVETQVRGKLLVGADGARSRVATQLRGGAPLRDAIVGVGAIADYDRNPLHDHVELFLDKEAAPGWFGWTIPLAQNVARLGTGTAGGVNPRESFRRLQASFPDSFGAAHIRRFTGGLIAIWQPTTMVHDRVVLVGDAARQVKPTSGGGIHAALRAAELAAHTAEIALRGRNLAWHALMAYAREWERTVGRELRRQSDMRRVLDRLSMTDVTVLLELIEHNPTRAALDDAADIDYPSRVVARLATAKPRLLFKVLRWPRHPLAWVAGG